jgi:hypothetical protein
METEYLGLSLTLAAAIVLGIYHYRSTSRRRRRCFKYMAAYHAGYAYCMEELLLGIRSISSLEDERNQGWPGEHSVTGDAFDHGMTTALNKWRETHQEISNG